MPKKKKTRDVEEILDGNIDQFEKGRLGGQQTTSTRRSGSWGVTRMKR